MKNFFQKKYEIVKFLSKKSVDYPCSLFPVHLPLTPYIPLIKF